MAWCLMAPRQYIKLTWILMISIKNLSLKFTTLKLHLHHPGDNEFNQHIMNALWAINTLQTLIASHCICGWAFLRWWPPSAMWEGPLIYYGRHRGCPNNPIFFNLGLCDTCWAHYMCHHDLWSTSVSQPFSFLNSSLGFAGRTHHQKITITIFRFVLQNLAIQNYLPYILFYRYLVSLLSSGWFVIAVCGSISVRGIS